MRTIRAQSGELLDAICAREYPDIELSTSLQMVIDANPELQDYSLLNNLGNRVINLPGIAVDEPKPTITLWGSA